MNGMLQLVVALLSMSNHGIIGRCSFTFDPDNFPDPKAYLHDIKSKYGVKICVWSKFDYLPETLAPLISINSKLVHFSAIPHFPRRCKMRILY
jgi:hypothetical protein